MSNLANIVKQIAVGADGKTVCVELICADEYGAQILCDDITSRLKTDRVLKLTVKCGAEIDCGEPS